MPLYRYIAVTDQDRRRSGVVVADSPRQVLEQLRDDGLFAQEVTEESLATGSTPRLSVLRPGQVSMMIRELSTLTHAGVPVSLSIQPANVQAPA